MGYPKIDTIWKRDDEGIIIPGDYSCPEFEAIKLWDVSEKIHGMNIKITQVNGKLKVAGRHDKKTAQIPPDLIGMLSSNTLKVRMWNIFRSKDVTLYGEGYGYEIHKGRHYNTFGRRNNLALFDVNVNGFWLSPENVRSVASMLGLHLAPQLRLQEIDQIISHVEKATMSDLRSGSLVAEGIVARSHPLMYFNNGKPIMFKLKVKDYTRYAMTHKES